MNKFVYILPLMVALSACSGTGKTMVLEAPPATRYVASSYHVVESVSTVGRAHSDKNLFEETIVEGLSKLGMKKGQSLEIEYRFIQHDQGNRVVRCLSGVSYIGNIFGGAGEGELSVEVTFRHANHNRLGRIWVSGRISSGFMGGSFDAAVEDAAKEVVKFVSQNYR